MNAKITVAIVCTFFLGMVWISSTSNNTFLKDSTISKKTVSIPAEYKTMKFINFDVSESTKLNDAEIQPEISDMNTCTLGSIATDTLTFGKAFGYYRQCRGYDSSFQWKGMEYTTLLSEEIIIQIADSIKVKVDFEEAEVSQIR